MMRKETIKTNVLQDDLDKVVFNMKKNSEHSRESNRLWMSVLRTYYINGENMLKPSYYDDTIENVTTEDIKKAAKFFLENADVLDMMVFPKDTAQQISINRKSKACFKTGFALYKV